MLDHPHAPWYQPSETSSLTQTAGNVAGLLRLGVDHPFMTRATELCWQRIEHGTPDNSYDLLFAIHFLDAVADEERAGAALDALGDVREALGEHTPLDVSPRPGSRSRRLFDADTIAAELDKLAGGQLDDGGWTFEWPAWNPAAAHEWRGIVTVQALTCCAPTAASEELTFGTGSRRTSLRGDSPSSGASVTSVGLTPRSTVSLVTTHFLTSAAREARTARPAGCPR